MKNLLNATTPFGWRCRKAGLLLIALGLAAICALLTPSKAQSVQSMVKNQPFPYAQGVAMDTTLYKNVKAKLEAAELLRINSAKSIADLQTQIKGTYAALEDAKKLGQYDAHQADSLRAVLATKIGLLQTATGDLRMANEAISKMLASLPRRIRKTLVNATVDQMAHALVEYVELLQARKWKWGGIGVGVGFVGSLIALLR